MLRASLVAQMVKNLVKCGRPGFDPWVGKDPLEESMATHSSIFAWRIPMNRGFWWATVRGVARVGHDWVTKHSTACKVAAWIYLMYLKTSLFISGSRLAFKKCLLQPCWPQYVLPTYPHNLLKPTLEIIPNGSCFTLPSPSTKWIKSFWYLKCPINNAHIEVPLLAQW